MGRLPQVRAPNSRPPPGTSCLETYEREIDFLFETIQRLGGSPRDTEDLAHEVFVVLHRNWPKLDTTRPLRPYLFGVAFRIVCAYRRRQAREIPYADLDALDEGVDPEGSAQSKELAGLLMAALDQVPLPRRAVIIMHDLDGCSVPDIAAQLSITRFGTYARLRKARRELAVAARRLLRRGFSDESQ